MNFNQLHERLRSELHSRIGRGLLTAAWLARKSGLRAPHISNFLRRRRMLSLSALDRILSALDLDLAELLEPVLQRPSKPLDAMPLYSQDAALHALSQPVHEHIRIPSAILDQLAAERPRPSRNGPRFIALVTTTAQSRIMEPIFLPGSMLILDCHAPLPSIGVPASRHMYAVRHSGVLAIYYVAVEPGMLILRPHSGAFAVQLLPIPPQTAVHELILGRVCAVLNTF